MANDEFILNRQVITANGNYDFKPIAGRKYAFTVGYLSGTGTVVVSDEVLDSGTFQTFQLPDDSTTAMTITAAVTDRFGFEVRPVGARIRFAVSSATSLEAIINVIEIDTSR